MPICDALRAWIKPIAKASGPVNELCPPNRRGRAGEGLGKCEAETVRLGGLIGGWKSNALRHSFISYRAAIVGLAQTAMEAGNSEGQAKRSYNDAKGLDEASAWFGVLP